jgi:hypothetical protein
MNSDLSVMIEHPSPIPNLNPQDLTELGSMMAAAGWTTLEVRALVAELQQIAAQVTIGMLPKVLDKMRQIQEARMHEIINRLRGLPMMVGYVQRDRVIQIIQDVASRTPRP